MCSVCSTMGLNATRSTRSPASTTVRSLICGSRAARGSAFGRGLVQRHGGANEGFQRRLVYLLALVEVDGAPCAPLETGVEEARRILQRGPFGEGHLHDMLVGLARADQSIVRPDRNSPLPLLDDFGIGFFDQRTEPAQHLAPPVAQLLDSRVDQLRRRLGLLRPALLHARRFLPLSPRVCRMILKPSSGLGG